MMPLDLHFDDNARKPRKTIATVVYIVALIVGCSILGSLKASAWQVLVFVLATGLVRVTSRWETL